MTAFPSREDLARYSVFVGEARAHAKALVEFEAGGRQGPEPLANRLQRARRDCRHRTLPQSQQSRTSPLWLLLLLVDQWPLLSLQSRLDRLAELGALVALAEAALAPANPQPQPRFRADLDG